MHFLPASLSATITRSSPPQSFDVNFESTPSLAWTNSLHSLVFSNSLWKFTRSDWLCRTQFHLHSLSQWFLTLAPLNFFLIEHQSPKWEQLRFSIQRRSKSKRRTWKLLSELNFSSCRRCFRQQTYLFVYISCTVHYWTLILSSATRPSIRIWQNLERN